MVNGKGNYRFQAFNSILLTLVILLCTFPFLYVLMGSFISPADFMRYGMTFPHNPSLFNYKVLLGPGSRLLISYAVTAFITVTGTAVSLSVTSLMAYGLSKKMLPNRNALTTFVFFTVLFSGGMIPTYLLVKALGLLNSLWSLILPSAVNTWYMLIMRNFFSELPDALEESARIDGAGDWSILFKIVYPLSLPVLATIGLFYGVERWNTWFDALLYISNPNKFPLQLVLNDIINFNSQAVDPSLLAARHQTMPSADILKMTAIIVSTLPIMCVYPFIQKYFVKGVMVGSVKG